MYVGNWIRPWPGEKVIGCVIAVSGDELLCRTAGGLRFTVTIADVESGRMQMYASGRRLSRPAQARALAN